MKDANSPIIDFYPTEFKLDLDGKKHTWQAVVLLPFIDEERLLKEIAPLEAELTGVDKKRNSVGGTYIFTSKKTSLANSLLALYDRAQSVPQKEWLVSSESYEKLIANDNSNVFGGARPYIYGNVSSHPPPFGKLDTLRKVCIFNYFKFI